jgi:hypothetical protein
MATLLILFQPNIFHFPYPSFIGCLHLNLTASGRSDLCIPRNETARPRSQFYIHVSVSDLYIPMIGPPILHDPGNISIADRYINVGLGTRPRSFISGNICFEFSVHCTELETLYGIELET